MSWLTLAEIASMCGGRLLGPDAPVRSVSTDTRRLRSGELFVALQGPRFDAHDVIEKGQASQAAGVLVARQLQIPGSQILVDDALLALSRLADAWRERLSLKVIALTGSNGKTTVKEMLASVLGVRSQVLATRGNLNNHIGVPLTVLAIRPDHDYAVIEMGANHPGEIGALTDIVQPDIALITNAAPAHLAGFGSLEGVARAKGEIFQGLVKAGTAIINADDPFADYWRGLVADHPRLSFGLEKPADVAGQWHSDGCLTIHVAGDSMSVKLPLEGRHNAANALAATAAALAVGTETGQIVQGLQTMRPVGGRLQARRGMGEALIFDDTYNANPASLQAALETIKAHPGAHWLVLGDMGELGDAAEALHRAAGEAARRAGVTRLFTLGHYSRHATEAFGTGAQHYQEVNDLVGTLSRDLNAEVLVLVKGSRAMHMEQVVAGLLASGTTQEWAQTNEDAA